MTGIFNMGINQFLDRLLCEACCLSYKSYTFKQGGVEVLASHVCGYTVFSVRGTDEARDWWRDLRLWPKGAGDYYFHSGYWKGAEEVIGCLRRYMKERKNQRILLTGHSMGAGIGLCLARMMEKEGYNVESFVGFGMPRSMSRIKTKNLGFEVHHYKLGKDIVPSLLPLGLFYRHVSKPIPLRTGSSRWFPNWKDHSIKRYLTAF